MGTSWSKRHATEVQSHDGTVYDRKLGQQAYWVRYNKWKAQFLDINGRWDERKIRTWKIAMGLIKEENESEEEE